MMPLLLIIFAQQVIEPIHPEIGYLIGRLGDPDRAILLLGQTRARPVIRTIVHEQEMTNSHVAVVAQEIGQAYAFIAQRDKDQNIVRSNFSGAIRNNGDFTPFAKGTYLAKPAHSAQFYQLARSQSLFLLPHSCLFAEIGFRSINCFPFCTLSAWA